MARYIDRDWNRDLSTDALGRDQRRNLLLRGRMDFDKDFDEGYFRGHRYGWQTEGDSSLERAFSYRARPRE